MSDNGFIAGVSRWYQATIGSSQMALKVDGNTDSELLAAASSSSGFDILHIVLGIHALTNASLSPKNIQCDFRTFKI